MEASQQLLFFFSALGAFNGLLLAAYLLFFLKPAQLSNRLLGLLILALSIRIGKSVFLNFNRSLAGEYLQIGLTACFFIGPLLLAYVIAKRDNLKSVPKRWYPIGGFLTAIIIGVGLYRPYAQYRDFWNGGFVQFIYLVWSVGILLSIYVVWPILKQKGRWTTADLWTINIVAGNLIVHLAYRYGSYTSYIVGALSFSFVFYLLGLWYVLHKRDADFLVAEKPKYGDRKIDGAEAEELLARCNDSVETERLYLDPNFKLADLAEAAGSTPHQVSQLLNDNLGQSFTTYLRAFRIRHAREAILTDDHLTLEAIGLESGFGSKSAFYAAFKEEMGTTPAKFRRSALAKS